MKSDSTTVAGPTQTPRRHRLLGSERWRASIGASLFPLAIAASVCFGAVNLSVQLGRAQATVAAATQAIETPTTQL